MVKHIQPIPANLTDRLSAMAWLEPWYCRLAEGAEFGAGFERELRREVAPGHLLFDVRNDVRAIAGRVDCDDALFWLGEQDGRFAVVHLTWSAKAEPADWPSTWIVKSLDDFADAMAALHLELSRN